MTNKCFVLSRSNYDLWDILCVFMTEEEAEIKRKEFEDSEDDSFWDYKVEEIEFYNEKVW